MFIPQFAQLFFDNRENALLFGQNVAQVLDRLDQLLVFVVDLLPLEAGQLIQAKIENLVRLVLTEGVTPIRQARGIANQNADLLDLLLVNSNASSLIRASSRLADPRMIRMNSSRFASAMRYPSRVSARSSALRSSKRVRRKTTS